MAMEPAKAIKKYKAENVKLQLELDDYAKTVGQLTLEKGWLEGKLKSLDLSIKKSMITPPQPVNTTFHKFLFP
jgi:hypothetical protein